MSQASFAGVSLDRSPGPAPILTRSGVHSGESVGHEGVGGSGVEAEGFPAAAGDGDDGTLAAAKSRPRTCFSTRPSG